MGFTVSLKLHFDSQNVHLLRPILRRIFWDESICHKFQKKIAREWMVPLSGSFMAMMPSTKLRINAFSWQQSSTSTLQTDLFSYLISYSFIHLYVSICIVHYLCWLQERCARSHLLWFRFVHRIVQWRSRNC